MCRNIHVLHNLEPATTDDEVRAAALQYVRKVSGAAKPSQANAAAFERAVEEIAHATRHLLDELVTSAPPRDREVLAAQARERSAARYQKDPAALHASQAQRGPLQRGRAAGQMPR